MSQSFSVHIDIIDTNGSERLLTETEMWEVSARGWDLIGHNKDLLQELENLRLERSQLR